ncbi:MAG: hypothetical protein QXY96_07450 [Candidatus Methanomethylicaceae archaeon]
MKIKIFDDIFSYFHALLGGLTCITPWPHAAFIIFIFVIYEIVESRSKIEIFYDFIEFIIGYVAMLILISIVKLLL